MEENQTGKPRTRPLEKLLLTKSEAAAMLNMSPRKLQELTRDGIVPSIRFSETMIRWSPAELRRWVGTLVAAAAARRPTPNGLTKKLHASEN